MPQITQQRKQSKHRRAHSRGEIHSSSANIKDQTQQIVKAMLYNPSICNIVSKEIDSDRVKNGKVGLLGLKMGEKRGFEKVGKAKNGKAYGRLQNELMIKHLKFEKVMDIMKQQSQRMQTSNKSLMTKDSKMKSLLINNVETKYPMINEFVRKETTWDHLMQQRPQHSKKSRAISSNKQSYRNQLNLMNSTNNMVTGDPLLFNINPTSQLDFTQIMQPSKRDSFVDLNSSGMQAPNLQRMRQHSQSSVQSSLNIRSQNNNPLYFQLENGKIRRISRPTTASSYYQPANSQRLSLIQTSLIPNDYSYLQEAISLDNHLLNNSQRPSTTQTHQILAQGPPLQPSVYHIQPDRPKSAIITDNKNKTHKRANSHHSVTNTQNSIANSIYNTNSNRGGGNYLGQQEIREERQYEINQRFQMPQIPPNILSDQQKNRSNSEQSIAGQNIVSSLPQSIKVNNCQESQVPNMLLQNLKKDQSIQYSEPTISSRTKNGDNSERSQQTVLRKSQTSIQPDGKKIRFKEDEGQLILDQKNKDLDLVYQQEDLNNFKNPLSDHSSASQKVKNNHRIQGTIEEEQASQALSRAQSVDFQMINEQIDQITMFEQNMNTLMLTQSYDHTVPQAQSLLRKHSESQKRNQNQSQQSLTYSQELKLNYQQLRQQQLQDLAVNGFSNQQQTNSQQTEAEPSLPLIQQALTSNLNTTQYMSRATNSPNKQLQKATTVPNNHQYLPSKKYVYLAQRLDRMKDLIEEIKYKEYLKRVEILNDKKAYLSTYRFVLTKDEKNTLIKEIQDRELAIDSEEKQMFDEGAF